MNQSPDSINFVSVVLAAGASTRMKTRRSKLLLDLLGKSIAYRAVDQAAILNPKKIVFVVGHQREFIEAEVKSHPKSSLVESVLQVKQQGTADAVRVALDSLEAFDGKNTHVFVMGGDSVVLRPESLTALSKNHIDTSSVMSFFTALLPDPGALGRVVRNKEGVVQKIVEYKNASPLEKSLHEVNSGFYLIQLEALRRALASVKRNELTGEFYFTDLVEFFSKEGSLVQAATLTDAKESLGLNTPKEYSEVVQVLRDRINQQWMDRGVLMMEPSSIWIEDTVNLEPDVEIGPHVHLKGTTTIETGAQIFASVLIEDSTIGRYSQIHSFSHLKGAVVGESNQIGPFARLREGSQLSSNVKVGNFVEIKKSKLHTGVRANHLTYLGDADIGEASNIGAGTITCNYDGYQKSSTKIGSRVFVGSNTSLVAPVEVGDGAVIGAGSVITKSVSANAIAVERSDQREIAGGAEKFRSKRKK